MYQFAATILALGAISAAMPAEDLSKYRDFQLGMNLSTVAKQAGTDPSQAKLLHRRPALLQELAWRPQPLGASSHSEPAKEVIFSFYDGELFRSAVNYDRYETEGLTADDFVEAISATYGPATRPTAPAKVSLRDYGEQQDVVAQWQDSQYRFDLIRSQYGSVFSLVGVLKRLEGPAQSATIEATRLDDKEAPQREADRLASENNAELARLEKARLINKPKFRP